MRETLLDMGFPAEKIDRALEATGNTDLQAAIDWLSKEDESTQESLEQTGEITADQITAQSLQCDDCGKLFRDASAAEFHAVKTQHANFSESTAQIKPLTAEEKAAKLAELKEKLERKREEKRLLDEAENKNKELMRRRNAKDAAEAKDRLMEAEMKKAVEQRKREKEEDRLARQRIKEQIERDRQERARKASLISREEEKMSAQGSQSSIAPSLPQTCVSSSRDYTEARIQVRIPSGPPLTHTFDAVADLQQVVDFVRQQHPSFVSIKLSQTFPRKIFTESDMKKSLKELGLVPSAALVAQI